MIGSDDGDGDGGRGGETVALVDKRMWGERRSDPEADAGE
ncbi:hypothetical protein J2744_000049 [Halorubrum trapanicum]|uniref:Uncharacterized protein n=1 Tax=Halorubrum trapanicum TaxID=29284 RepID=A0A8J7RR19_9EURY|nr:hypothetical protein [Halorubrum trapanicum]